MSGLEEIRNDYESILNIAKEYDLCLNEEELKALIEKAFFSKSTGENIFGYASETLMKQWREEEEKTEFWQKVNEQLDREKGKLLQKRFLNFLQKN